MHGPADVAVLEQVEHQDRHRVVAAEADGGRVSKLQVTSQDLVVVQSVEPDGVRVGLGITVVHAVDALGHQHHLRADLQRALRCGGVGREERRPKARAENDNTALLQVPDRPTRHVRLGDLPHRDGGLHPGLGVLLLQEVLQGQTVHDRAEHAHVVGSRTVHAAHRQFGAPEEVAASDDDRDLNAFGDHDADLSGDGDDDIRVDAERAVPSERLSGQLEDNPLITLIRLAAVAARNHSAELDLVRIGQLRAPHQRLPAIDGVVGRHRWPGCGRRPYRYCWAVCLRIARRETSRTGPPGRPPRREPA